MLRSYLSYSLVALSAIFVIVDPISVVPIFIAMTSDQSLAERRRTALRACLASAALLSVFALFGAFIFKIVGITLGAFKIAGGILLLLTALDMLRAQPARTRSTPAEEQEGAKKEDVAIVPLAVPLLAGPGSVATVMVLMSRGKGYWVAGPVIAAIGVTFVVTYFMLRASTLVDRALGKSGAAVMERVMGLLMAAISIQFVVDGAADLMPEILSKAHL